MRIKVECFLLFSVVLPIARRINALQYLSGDFLENPETKGPNGEIYPRKYVEDILKNDVLKLRSGRAFRFLEDPWTTRKKLLEGYALSRTRHQRSLAGREILVNRSSANSVLLPNVDATIKIASSKNSSLTSHPVPSLPDRCSSPKTPQRLCTTKFNTTAPMYGVSLTSGQPVTIVQKFPDLLQQVIFEVCTTDTCDVVHGECVQTYMPYLFLVIPLGPVTLTGQDYILVESGCVCKPKFAADEAAPNPLDIINLGADLNND